MAFDSDVNLSRNRLVFAIALRTCSLLAAVLLPAFLAITYVSAEPPMKRTTDRFQMLQFESTVLLLDKTTGETWQLVVDSQKKPVWSAILRETSPSNIEKSDAGDSDKEPGRDQIHNAPAESFKQNTEAGANQIQTRSQPPRVSYPKRPLATGPIQFSLIPNHDIVIMRGPEDSVRAAKEAIQAMSERAKATPAEGVK